MHYLCVCYMCWSGLWVDMCATYMLAAARVCCVRCVTKNWTCLAVPLLCPALPLLCPCCALLCLAMPCRYIGGETRLVGLKRTNAYSDFLQQLSKATSAVWDEVRSLRGLGLDSRG